MQRRRAERIPVNMPAELVFAGRTYSGTIINVSEDGIGSAVTSVIEIHEKFIPVNDIALGFTAPSGSLINLSCELAWFARNRSDERHITIGMKITRPPSDYMEFIRTIYSSHLGSRTKEQLIEELQEAHRKISALSVSQWSSGAAEVPHLSEDAYRAIVESSEDSIYIVDRALRYQFMNRRHLERLNLSSGQYLGCPYRDFHSRQEADEFEAMANEVFSKGTYLIYEHMSSADGRHYLRTISPIRGEDNEVDSVSVISKNITDRRLAEELLLKANQELERQVRGRTADLLRLNEDLNREVTERRQTEQALKKASEDWRITLDSTKDMILMLDENFRLIKLNKAATGFLDRTYGQLIGQDFFELFADMDVPKEGHPLFVMRRSGRHEEAEIYFRDRDIWVLALADPVLDDKGNVTGAVHIIRDITEQKSLQSQLLHAQKMESIGRLAGGVAHDFNNILSSIMGYTELSLLKLPEGSPVKDYLVTVQEGAEKAAALTHRLLAFSRKQVLQVMPVDLNATIEGMVKMVARILREDISLELNIAQSVRTVVADPVQIEQILMNLIVNARDAMPDGGRLIIETADVYLDEDFIVRHEHARPGPYVKLVVSDTGIGMSRKVQERIFEPFFTTKGIGEGTGLGLATVYGIVSQHNGYIYVYSELGKGTTFKIYLPASGDEASEAALKDHVYMAGGSETVLVVDDDVSIRRLIRDVLEPLGYRLVFACDGEDALGVAGRTAGHIDLLLTDLVMPKMNGRLLASHFRREYPDTKIIFMSGYTDETVSQQGDLSISDMLLQKPLSPSLLSMKLREVLDKKLP